MTDHSDDTILDGELDENEFNFDIEHEDALLAENEYDLLEKSKCSEKNQKKDNDEEALQIEDEERDQLGIEIEEDVLDIGIVDEDIVYQDTVYLQDSVASSFKEKKCQGKRNYDKARDCKKIDTCSKESQEMTKTTGTTDDTVRSKLDQVENREISVVKSTPEGIQNRHVTEKKRGNDANNSTTKPNVISLRKTVKKSYDNVPDLAKVIESVQPVSTNSRARKIKRPENYDRKRRDGTDGSHSKYDHEERKRKELPSYVQDHNENHARDRHRDYDGERDHDRERERDRDHERERKRDRNHERERDCDHEKDRDYDRDREREKDSERERDRDYDQDRHLGKDRERDYDRDGHNDYDCGRASYREGYSSSENNKSHIPPYNRLDETSEVMSFKYQENSITQYHPGQPIITKVQIPQQRYDFHEMRPAAAPQILNQQPHTNALGAALNQHLYQRMPPTIQLFPNTARPPPQPEANVVMQNFPHQPMNVGPPHHQGFRPTMLQMNQRPPHSQPLMAGRGTPIHVQPPLFCGSARPQLQPPQMVRPGALPPQLRPPFNASVNVKPPPMRLPMDHMRPGSVPMERPPPPSILGLPPHQIVQMLPQRNQFPGNNGIRMGVPFRPNFPPPQNVPRSHVPPLEPAPYYDNCNQLPAINPQIPHQQPAGKAYVSRGCMNPLPPRVPNQDQNMRHMYSNVLSNVDSSYTQYPQSNYYSKQLPQHYIDGKEDFNPLKRRNSSIDESPSKLARYDYLFGNKNEDEEMRQYRVKIEEQKKLREQLVEQKEELRLQNQMQNFIQNNIKGILEKREQFRRKNEVESAKHLRETERTTESSVKDSSSSRRHDACSYSSSERRGRRSVSPSRPSETTVRSKNMIARERVRVAIPRNEIASRRNSQRTEKIERKEKFDLEIDRGQLHKVLKITYKDGTVALKSIPVQGNNLGSKVDTPAIKKNFSSNKLEINIGDEDPNNLNRRRMVVSKDVSIANVKNELNENIIVESVRKAVTKSSIPLAQRFSNLTTTNKVTLEDDDNFMNEIKSKGRLVLPDEERSRTVWVKNIASSTNPTLMKKTANTCGHVSKMNWINGGASPNQAKITFSKMEEAKKFCYNFNRKMVDISMITVSMMSEAR